MAVINLEETLPFRKAEFISGEFVGGEMHELRHCPKVITLESNVNLGVGFFFTFVPVSQGV